MLVKDLSEVKFQDTQYVTSTLGNVLVKDRVLHVDSMKVALDDNALNTLGRYLTIPNKFLQKLPANLADETVGHFLQKWEDAEATFAFEEGGLKKVASSELPVYDYRDYFGIIQSVMPADAVICDLNYYGSKLEVNVRTSVLTTSPRVNDITEGGLRFIGHTGPTARRPYVSTYMERLVCSNGMTTTEEGSLIRIKGMTAPEILAEMERYANQLLGDVVPERLSQWRGLAEQKVSNPATLINALGRRYRINSNVISHMIDNTSEMEGNSVYDVVNFITSYQNNETVGHRTSQRLQFLGGEVVRNHNTRQCVVCNHELV